MKVVIEGKAHFNGADAEPHEVPVEVVGPPDEDIDDGMILLVHPDVSLELNVRELRRALRVFE